MGGVYPEGLDSRICIGTRNVEIWKSGNLESATWADVGVKAGYQVERRRTEGPARPASCPLWTAKEHFACVPKVALNLGNWKPGSLDFGTQQTPEHGRRLAAPPVFGRLLPGFRQMRFGSRQPLAGEFAELLHDLEPVVAPPEPLGTDEGASRSCKTVQDSPLRWTEGLD
jgi:hypothetical protein